MLEVQRFLKNGTIEDLEKIYDIGTKIYDDRVILKYRVNSKPKFHPIVLECRGLILSLPDYKVMARGFDRFFNYGEGDDKDTFNWDNCIVFNKLDGSLIKVYHDGCKWCTSTNGTAFAEGETPMGKTFHDLFIDAIGTDLEHGFEFCSKHHTYIFELTSPENRIVTRYSKTSCTLLAVRNNNTGLYVDYNQIGVETEFQMQTNGLVQSYNINTPEDIIKFVEDRDQMDEGVVCYDNVTQKRIKIKNSAYVAIHHLRGNEVTRKSLVALCLKGETEEYLTYFPEDFDLIEPYIKTFEKLKTDITETYNKYKDIEDQKEFALKVKDLSFSSFLFSLRKFDNITVDDLFTVDKLTFIIKFFEGV